MRLVSLLISVAALGVLIYWMTRGGGARPEVSAPKQTIERVRVTTDHISQDAQKSADELLQRTH